MLILLIKTILWILFFLSALLLIVVILLQEPKGGGLAEAFGGMGAQTFGVKSGGPNKFTFTVFGVFMVSALFIHVLRHSGTVPAPKDGSKVQAPENPGGGTPPVPVPDNPGGGRE